jgi:CPA2 family monovalent cation:H+ antiporter-2
VRRVIAEVIPLLSLGVIFLLIALLSASMLPTSEWLLLIVLVAAVIAAVLWRWFIRVHTRMQIALLETLGNHQEPSDL